MTWQVICGDCLEVMRTMEAGSFDAVVTDPPYKIEFLHVWEPLAEQSFRLLKDGGLLLTLTGHYSLDKVLPAMSKHLKFYWIGGMLGGTATCARNFSRQIMCAWKPALWFAKGKVPDHPFVFDLFKCERIERVNHKWEQPVGWFEYYISKLVAEGRTVLDPFCGSGTTGVACVKTGRNFVGIEINPEYCEIARKRIAQAEAEIASLLPMGVRP